MASFYAATPDPYFDDENGVLYNLPGLTDPSLLAAYEAEAVSRRALGSLPPGTFDTRHYKALHRYLFQDIYAWAGKPRKVRITKGESVFCYPEHIEAELRRLEKSLRQQNNFVGLEALEFSARAAAYYAEMNAIHAFREGNGRTQNIWLGMLSHHAGHPLNLERLNPEQWLAACVTSFHGSSDMLASEIYRLL